MAQQALTTLAAVREPRQQVLALLAAGRQPGPLLE